MQTVYSFGEGSTRPHNRLHEVIVELLGDRPAGSCCVLVGPVADSSTERIRRAWEYWVENDLQSTSRAPGLHSSWHPVCQ